MARGGKREGAGRPAGSRNKANAKVLEKASKGGEMPLDYMLRVMRDGNAPVERRDDMAKGAAAYLHPKLQATTLRTDPDAPPKVIFEVTIVKPEDRR